MVSNVLLVGPIFGEFSFSFSKLSYDIIGLVSMELLIFLVDWFGIIYVGVGYYWTFIYYSRLAAFELLNLFERLFPYLWFITTEFSIYLLPAYEDFCDVSWWLEWLDWSME